MMLLEPLGIKNVACSQCVELEENWTWFNEKAYKELRASESTKEPRTSTTQRKRQKHGRLILQQQRTLTNEKRCKKLVIESMYQINTRKRTWTLMHVVNVNKQARLKSDLATGKTKIVTHKKCHHGFGTVVTKMTQGRPSIWWPWSRDSKVGRDLKSPRQSPHGKQIKITEENFWTFRNKNRWALAWTAIKSIYNSDKTA